MKLLAPFLISVLHYAFTPHFSNFTISSLTHSLISHSAHEHLPVLPVVLLYISGNKVASGIQSADCAGCQLLAMVALVIGSASSSVQVIKPGFLVALLLLLLSLAADVAAVVEGDCNLGASVVNGVATVVVVVLGDVVVGLGVVVVVLGAVVVLVVVVVVVGAAVVVGAFVVCRRVGLGVLTVLVLLVLELLLGCFLGAVVVTVAVLLLPVVAAVVVGLRVAFVVVVVVVSAGGASASTTGTLTISPVGCGFGLGACVVVVGSVVVLWLVLLLLLLLGAPFVVAVAAAVLLTVGLRTGRVVVVTLLLALLVESIGLRVAVVVPLVAAAVAVVAGFLGGTGRLLDCVLWGFCVVVRSGGVGRGVVVVVVVVVGAAVVVVVVGALVVVLLLILSAEVLLLLWLLLLLLLEMLLLMLLLTVGLCCRLVVVSGTRLVASVADGVVVSTIWKVTNLLGTVVVSMRCSTAGAVVSTGRVVVVRRRSGFKVVINVGAVLGLIVVRTTKCEFLCVVCAAAGRRVVLGGWLAAVVEMVVRTGLAVLK